jgi:hypothetical protein
MYIKTKQVIDLLKSLAPRSPHGLLGALIFVLRQFYLGGVSRIKGFLGEIEQISYYQVPKIDDQRVPGYLIWVPNYESNSAGVKSLYQLCNDLNELGYQSFVFGAMICAPSFLNSPLIKASFARRLGKRGYVAVYPEIVRGNPIGSRKVARWVLNKPGYLGGEAVYDRSEKIFYYADGYRESIKNEISGQLLLPTLDESIFFDDGRPFGSRSLVCFYVGKSKWKEGFFDKKAAFEIKRDSPGRIELGHLFRAAKVLYCFDNSTILTYEALLCGCPVVIIPDGTQSKEDYIHSELGIDGIAWGVEELGRAAPNPASLRQKVAIQRQVYREQLLEFVRITQAD